MVRDRLAEKLRLGPRQGDGGLHGLRWFGLLRLADVLYRCLLGRVSFADLTAGLGRSQRHEPPTCFALSILEIENTPLGQLQPLEQQKTGHHQAKDNQPKHLRLRLTPNV